MAQPRPPDTSASGMRPPATCPGLGLCTILPLLPRVVGPQAPGPLRHCGHGAPPPPGPRAGSRAGSTTDLCASPLVASSIMMTTSAVRATAITCRPRPFPGRGGGRWSCSDTGRTVWRPDACPYRPAMDSAPCHPWLACVSNPVLSRSWRRAAGGNWPHHPGRNGVHPPPREQEGSIPPPAPTQPAKLCRAVGVVRLPHMRDTQALPKRTELCRPST